MASPQRLASALSSISPLPRQRSSQIRQYLSPKTPIRETCKRDVKSESLLSPFNIDTPNRLKILKDGLPKKHRTVLGSGGFGTVYKASYKGDEVAAKIIQMRKCSDTIINSEKRASFLRHSNIVKVLTIEQGDSLSLITMELCGTTLQDYLEENTLSKDERIRILKDISCALQFCHRAHIVHADVKPRNILMNENGQVKLTDFGSSVLMDEPNETLELHGTPGYAAPEILKGNVPTPAADIYSLGIVAWQMLSRELPFAGLHIHTIIYLSAKGTRPKDNDIDDGFQGGYKNLYREMWSQRIIDRPTSDQVIDRINTLIRQ